MRVICFGDSLTSCGGSHGRFSDILADRFPAHEFINRGGDGDAFPGALARIQSDVLDLHPHVDLHNFFGLTETISMTHVLTGAEAEERPESIGRLLPFVEALIVDENGQAVAPGVSGELLFSRDNVIPGYYNDADRLTQAIVEIDQRLWFRTGDIAMPDEDGYFFLKGRKKDMIIVAGKVVKDSLPDI